MSEPAWLTAARSRLGTRETPGPRSTPAIIDMARRVGARILGIPYTSDETAWCGLFVAWCMITAGLQPPPIAIRAKAWATWGRELYPDRPRVGCVMVFGRAGGGHVGFYVSEDETAYHVLGGNQGNAVTITRIAKDRLLRGGMRWPHGPALPAPNGVVRPWSAALSVNEA